MMLMQQQQDLSEDLISEILSWLPVSSISKFQYVSKCWLNLITSCTQNPSFVKAHINHSKQIQHDPTFMFCHSSGILCPMELNNAADTNSSRRRRHRPDDDDTPVYQYFYYNYADEKLEVVYTKDPHEFDNQPINGFMLSDPCNGLFILAVCGVCCLWNPCTQEYKRIPKPSVEWPNIQKDDCYRRHEYGLAYDPILDDYKVIIYVFIHSYSDDFYFDSQVLVYTLGTNSWRLVPDPYKLTVRRGYIKKKPLYLNGAHHWLAFEHYSQLAFSVLSFDVAGEEYRELPKPPFFDKMHDPQLHLLRGCLCIFDIDNDVLNVWVMKDYGVEESWTKLFSTVQLDIVHSSHFLKPLWSWKNSDDILIEKDSKDVILYDPQRDKAKLLGLAGPCPGPPRDRWHDTQAYTGSFVSLKSGTYVHMINKYKDEKEEYRKKKKRKLNKDLR